MTTEARKRWVSKHAEELRQYRRAYYEAHKAELIADQRAYRQSRRAENPEAVRAAGRARLQRWRDANRDHVRAWDQQYRASHPDKVSVHQHRWYATNGKPYQSAWYSKLRAEMIVAYGGACACCGETTPTFLCIDHMNRDGGAHRLSLATRGGTGGRSRDVYLDLRRRGWPRDRYQLLCFNCNFATRYGDLCPHRANNLIHLAAVEYHTTLAAVGGP